MGDDFDAYLELPSAAITRVAKRTWKAAVRANEPHVTTGAMRYNWKLSTKRRGSYVPVRVKRPPPMVPKFNFRVRYDNRFYLYNNMPYAEKAEKLDPGDMLKQASMFFKHAVEFELDRVRNHKP